MVIADNRIPSVGYDTVMLILLPEKYHDTDTFCTYHDN